MKTIDELRCRYGIAADTDFNKDVEAMIQSVAISLKNVSFGFNPATEGEIGLKLENEWYRIREMIAGPQ